MKITAIRPQKRRTERANIEVDGEFRLALAEELILRHGLRVGVEISDARIAELEAEDLLWKAKQASLNLLSHRPRSARELERRLERKEFPPDVVDRAVRELTERGLIDDSAFAESFVRDRLRFRPKGRRLLTRELRSKGVDPEVAEAAVGETMEAEAVSELDLARAAAVRWKPRGGEDPAAARRRLYGYLARRGFGGEAIRTVLEERLG